MIESKYNHVIYGHGENFVMMFENGHVYREFELKANQSDCRVHFLDGTVVRFSLGKPDMPDTWICVVENVGKAQFKITRCTDPDAAIKSDVFEIDSVIFYTRKTDRISMRKKKEALALGETAESHS